ncbi:hypothetical protein OGAPHI_005948 [Ogataea philodendri]|uniref:WKF domain-containing protein n=1 Tax=Ogataea philodendri TaxID=1378263 RepID=A0A9P8NXV0_9ASCO|nr:uncharacterized protein OGAPHI_005948 [Ogataea philodendri]KAH3661770.1 hypothetical protein OGAPHI_005948 [Ogataea philodendri]
MSEPAWKRLGLKIKETVETDPLYLTKVNVSRKRKVEPSENTEKKPPKRKKLPKSERPAPPEKDQLKYLRQYNEDRENWKFSKAKQAWILRNIKHIPAEYEESLMIYVNSIQGGSKDRLKDDMVAVIEKWNTAANTVENSKSDVTGEEANEGSSGEPKETDQEKKSSIADDKDIPDFNYVMLAKKIYEMLTGTKIDVAGAVEEEKQEEQEEHPLIVEEVDVEEYLDDNDNELVDAKQSDSELATKKPPKKHKDKKSKSKKEKKSSGVSS